MARTLDGKVVRDKIAEELKKEISRLRSKCKLVIFQVGDVAESNTYIGQKVKFGEKIGAVVTLKKLAQDVPQSELIQQIQLANENKSVTGIIVQLPIPDSLGKDEVIEAIDPKKDVDGQTSTNVKALVEGSSRQARTISKAFLRKTSFVPATTKGILTLLDHYKIPVEGKHVVVVGRSALVGKPTALAFLNADATVTVCHKKTINLKLETRNADILVVAVGKPNTITKEHVKAGQVVVDVGINVQDEVQDEVEPRYEVQPRILIGDVDFDAVSKIVAAITPVPGGVGPMTVASLFQNLLEACLFQNK